MIQKQVQRLTLDHLQPSAPQPAAFLEAGQGPTLLMLHGFMGSADCWLSLIDRLESTMHCVALDLMGFGDSSKPAIK